MKPDESESVNTLAPISIHFSVAYWATFPDPDITTDLPFSPWLKFFNISSIKYTTPYPVASGLISDPPHETPLPVNTPENSFFNLLY